MTTEFATVVPTITSSANDANSETSVTTEASGVVSNVQQDSTSQAALIANINSTAAAITQLGQKGTF